KGNCSLENEEYRECASCEATSDNQTPMCNKMCQPARCMCKAGFYRNNKGICVAEKECGSIVSQFPLRTLCVSVVQCYARQLIDCEPTCKNKDQIVLCLAICKPAACQCKVGYYRADDGDCVPEEECSALFQPTSQADCGPNMTFKQCSSPCQSKCGEYEPKPCVKRCDPPKCECNAGFYFNSVGDCVSKADCELDVPVTCANVDCKEGFMCIMQNGKPACIRPCELLTIR
ncbi:hypothetical protein PMAYCL1PPCAC_26327, partial [Pristionchus mayeri]